MVLDLEYNTSNSSVYDIWGYGTLFWCIIQSKLTHKSGWLFDIAAMRFIYSRLIRGFGYTSNQSPLRLSNKLQESVIVHARTQYNNFGHAYTKEPAGTLWLAGFCVFFICIGTFKFVQWVKEESQSQLTLLYVFVMINFYHFSDWSDIYEEHEDKGKTEEERMYKAGV